MMATIILVSGFTSIVFISARLYRMNGSKGFAKTLFYVPWLACLAISAAAMAYEESKTYVPSSTRVVGYWVNSLTGAIISTEYESIGGHGLPPVGLFLLMVIVWTIFGLIIGGSIAAGKNLACLETGLKRKALTFLSWFIRVLLCGVVTVGLLPAYAAYKTSATGSLKKNMRRTITVVSILSLLYTTRTFIRIHN